VTVRTVQESRARTCSDASHVSNAPRCRSLHALAPSEVYKHVLEGSRAKLKHSKFVSQIVKDRLMSRAPARMIVCDDLQGAGHHLHHGPSAESNQPTVQCCIMVPHQPLLPRSAMTQNVIYACQIHVCTI
jgi:hypothetical protein